jgi:sulfite exporter TauE/SafE
MLQLFENATSVLLGTTATVAVAHTLLGVDHSLPFIVLGRARRWSLRRTIAVTIVCGIGHVASSVAIGGLGAVAGVTLDSLVWVESARGEVAATLLIGFGLAYAAWAVWHLLRGRDHAHVHYGEHLHSQDVGTSLTPWALFIIFLFGPCEPLIPLMVVPAMSGDWEVLAAVIAIFGILTVVTMSITVAVGYRVFAAVLHPSLTRSADLVAGLVVAASGATVLFLGL